MTPRYDNSGGRGPQRGRVPSADHVPVPAAPPPPAPAAPPAAPPARAAEPAGMTGDRTPPTNRKAIVDASNVAHAGGRGARLATLLAVRDELVEQGFEPILVADAALRHQIDDKVTYEQLVETGDLQQAPAGTDADYFVLKFATELDAVVVSNDRFRDGGKLADAVKNRQIRFMVVAGEVVLEKRTQRR